MIKRILPIAIMAMVAGLYGCGDKSVAAGVSKETANASNQESTFERIKSMDVGKTSKNTVQVPMLPLFEQAVASVGKPYDENLKNMCVGLTFGAVDQIDNITEKTVNKHFDGIFAQIKAALLDNRDNKFGPDQMKIYREFLGGSSAESADNCALAVIHHYTFNPVTGWEFDPRRDEIAPKAEGVIASAQIVAAEQFAPVASSLSKNAFRDPDDLAKQAADAFAKKKIPWMLLLTHKTKELRNQAITIPADGGNPVGFSIGKYYVELGPQGGKLSFAGTTWLGNANILGKTYMASLESTSSSGLTQRKTLSGSSSISSGNKTGASAVVGK